MAELKNYGEKEDVESGKEDVVIHLIEDIEPGDPRLLECLFPVLQELRPFLTPELFLTVYKNGYPQGLRFSAVFQTNEKSTNEKSTIEETTKSPAGECVGVAGWRIQWLTFGIKKLYVDDLVTKSTARSSGVGRTLLGYLEKKARMEECTKMSLDSGCQRASAHKFYFRENLTVTSFHFEKPLK